MTEIDPAGDHRYQFQFLIVRLKCLSRAYTTCKLLFQFLIVRLKSYKGYSWSNHPQAFQFLIVRLKS